MAGFPSRGVHFFSVLGGGYQTAVHGLIAGHSKHWDSTTGLKVLLMSSASGLEPLSRPAPKPPRGVALVT